MKTGETRIKILLVEDDVNLGFLMVEFLESKGFEVKLYRDGISGLKGFESGKYDFCILDIMLPGLDGFSLAGKIREINPDTPMIFLTARSMKEDKIKGFRLGIDDYVTKPFDEDELYCRIMAIMNRVQQGGPAKGDSTFLKIGRYTFDPANQLLALGSNTRRLTLKENKILCKLAGSMNNIVSREEIMNEVWGSSDYYTGRSLDVFISKIRNYLKEDHSLKITTIPTIGYILMVEKNRENS
ncbi:MAG TPA: response regulator transcription factor [Bacteroidales bacterium]|nr:response regulator transcription factor [Bacteroidales bacterium]